MKLFKTPSCYRKKNGSRSNIATALFCLMLVVGDLGVQIRFHVAAESNTKEIFTHEPTQHESTQHEPTQHEPTQHEPITSSNFDDKQTNKEKADLLAEMYLMTINIETAYKLYNKGAEKGLKQKQIAEINKNLEKAQASDTKIEFKRDMLEGEHKDNFEKNKRNLKKLAEIMLNKETGTNYDSISLELVKMSDPRKSRLWNWMSENKKKSISMAVIGTIAFGGIGYGVGKGVNELKKKFFPNVKPPVKPTSNDAAESNYKSGNKNKNYNNPTTKKDKGMSIPVLIIGVILVLFIILAVIGWRIQLKRRQAQPPPTDSGNNQTGSEYTDGQQPPQPPPPSISDGTTSDEFKSRHSKKSIRKSRSRKSGRKSAKSSFKSNILNAGSAIAGGGQSAARSALKSNKLKQ